MEIANGKLKETDSPKFTRGHILVRQSDNFYALGFLFNGDENKPLLIGYAGPQPYFNMSAEEARGNAYLWANAHKLYDKAKALFDACGLADAAGDLSCYIDGELLDEVSAALADCRVPANAEAQAEATNSEK